MSIQKKLLWAVAVVAGLCAPALAAQLFGDSFTRPDGLITNDFATYNPGAAGIKVSPYWQSASGSLFARNNYAWTGAPDTIVSNASSSNGTGSAIFRLFTKRTDFGDVSVRFKLFNQGLVTTTRTPAQNYDGVHIWLRYQDETKLYVASVNRRDGWIVIKKKGPGGPSNGGSYYDLAPAVRFAVPYRSWHTVEARAQNQNDGSVELKLLVNGSVLISAVDRGTGGAPLLAPGRVGIRGDNCDFFFDEFRVDSIEPAASAIVNSNVRANDITHLAAKILWNTNIVSHSQVEYGTTSSYGLKSARSTATGLWHSMGLSALRPQPLYHYRVRSADDAGREGVSGDYTFTTLPEPAAPKATKVAAIRLTPTSAFISWTTDTVSHSQVEYGRTSSYGILTGVSSASGLYHGVQLSNLTPGALYHYRVRSRDAAGREGVSGDFVFTTPTSTAPAGR